MSSIEKWRAVVIGAAVAAVTAFAPPVDAEAASAGRGPTSASAPVVCETHWGSLAKTGAAPDAEYWFALPGDGSAVDNVRAGRHSCYDRLVVDVLGSRPGFRVQYVDAIRQYSVVPGERGDPVALAGGAFLEIIVPTNSGLVDGTSAYAPADRDQLVDVSNFRTLRQVVETGWYEHQRQFGVGVRGRLPFRTFTLSGPGDHSRLVIDVAHHW